jgi:hypothetical protein
MNSRNFKKEEIMIIIKPQRRYNCEVHKNSRQNMDNLKLLKMLKIRQLGFKQLNTCFCCNLSNIYPYNFRLDFCGEFYLIIFYPSYEIAHIHDFVMNHIVKFIFQTAIDMINNSLKYGITTSNEGFLCFIDRQKSDNIDNTKYMNKI